MSLAQFLQYTILGLAAAGVYAVAASGLVVTYTTTGIFNFAHGAVGMIAAYTYWELRINHHLPAPLSLFLVLLVLAPLMGIVIERVVMRKMGEASTITQIVVTIGLLATLIGIGNVLWPAGSATKPYTLPSFFGDARLVHIGGVAIPWHSLVVLACAGLVALGLRLLLHGTRLGVAMRAVVDDRELTSLTGGNPDTTATFSWVLGCFLAALAGVLIAPIVSLSVAGLTLLVINAYAAAIVGRLRSLPLTYLGALILGLGDSYFSLASAHMSRTPTWITDLHNSLPVILLFVVLLVLPQDRVRVTDRIRARSNIPMPSLRKAATAGVALVVVAFVAAGVLHGSALRAGGQGLALAVVMLSLVPLIGYAGQISLAQLAFAGIGALAAVEVVGANGSPLGFLVAAVVAGAVGALVALPALRLKDLYLALATMAFALFVEQVVFAGIDGFSSDTRVFGRFSLVSSDRAYFVFMAAVFAVLGFGVVVLRRSPFGRRLQAMKDSPAGCATVGMSLTATKLIVFSLSAAIAGVGGYLLACWKGSVGVDDYSLLTGALAMLPVLLLAVVGGITAVSGALIGALILVALPQVAEAYPSLTNLMILLPGLVGISLARNPDGLVADLSRLSRRVRDRYEARQAATEDSLHVPRAARARAVQPEAVAFGRRAANDDELRALEAGLGVVREDCGVVA